MVERHLHHASSLQDTSMFLIPFDATGSECSTLGRSCVLCPADEETEARGRRDPAGVPRRRDPRAWMGGQVPPGPRPPRTAHSTRPSRYAPGRQPPKSKQVQGQRPPVKIPGRMSPLLSGVTYSAETPSRCAETWARGWLSRHYPQEQKTKKGKK